MWSVQQQQQQQHLPTYLLPIFSSASATVKDEQDGDRGGRGEGTDEQTDKIWSKRQKCWQSRIP